MLASFWNAASFLRRRMPQSGSIHMFFLPIFSMPCRIVFSIASTLSTTSEVVSRTPKPIVFPWA